MITLSIQFLLYSKKGGDNLRLMSKILVIAGIILAAPLAVTLILQNWTATIGTSTPISLKLDWLIQYEPLYLFWSGVILAIVLLVLLLTTILWPRSQLLYLHQKSAGQVTVSKKAIENFTLAALQEELFIGNPKVSAKLASNKITLKISGNLLNSANAKQQTSTFLNQLKDDLRVCLGISEQKKIKIRLVNFSSSKSNMNRPRVI